MSPKDPLRNQTIRNLRSLGLTLEEIASQQTPRITGERVRQILKRTGGDPYPEKERTKMRQLVKKELLPLYLRYGISKATYNMAYRANECLDMMRAYAKTHKYHPKLKMGPTSMHQQIGDWGIYPSHLTCWFGSIKKAWKLAGFQQRPRSEWSYPKEWKTKFSKSSPTNEQGSWFGEQLELFP